MLFEIKNRWSGALIFSLECGSMRLCVEAAVSQRVSLRAADLRAANLRAANLRAANLSDADLRAANLSDADLSDADLSAADLRAANLSDADLRAANLSDADLSDANLSDADLSDADLQPIRDDFYAVLSQAPAEVAALIEALAAGRVNGSTYSDGECGCLIGTLAIASGVDPAKRGECEIVHGLGGNSSRPAERFFLSIQRGSTPENSQHAKLAHEWATEWLARMTAAFGAKAESGVPS